MSKQDVVCVFKYVGVVGVIVLTVALYAPAPPQSDPGTNASDTVVDAAA